MCFAAYLATDWRLDPIAKKRVFCILRLVFQNLFNFPSSFSDYSLSSLKYLSQTLHVSSEKASIFASCLLQTSRKRRVFSISLHCSWFEIYFLDLWDTTVFFEIICSNMGLPKMLGMIVWDWFLLLLSLFSVIFFFIRLLVCVLSIVIW